MELARQRNTVEVKTDRAMYQWHSSDILMLYIKLIMGKGMKCENMACYLIY